MSDRSDFNDLANVDGLAEVAEAIEKAAQKAQKQVAGKVISLAKVANTSRSHAENDMFDAEGRRVIRHQQGQLPATLDALGVALGESKSINLFRYAGHLARVYQSDECEDKNIKRPAGAIMLHPVDAAHLVEIATRSATHEKWDARRSDFVLIDCPRRVADSYIARGHWPELPDLAGFIETPTITQDGRVIDTPGYDMDSGLFCAFGKIHGYQRPPPKPSKDDAEQALIRLLELFKTFPFVDDVDRVAMLAGVLTAIQRRLLPAAPLFGITAPTPGTGKTLLCETLALVATARRASVLSLGHDDAETEKRLAGSFLAGDACLLIDNVERPLKGDLLCQATTQQFLRLRPLGGSGMLNVPTHAMIIATGNNLAVVGDLKRRVVMVRLDAKTERPEHRTFDRDHLKLVSEKRGQIITDAITIVAAFLAAGAPSIAGLHGVGGFELWDKMVRRPLAWLELPDPMQASEELRTSDPDMECMRLVFGAWHDAFGARQVTAAEVVASATSVGQSANDDLRDALQLACSEKPNARRLGNWLRCHRDKIIDNAQLKQSGLDSRSKSARWKVISAGSAGSAGSVSTNA